MDTLTKFKKRLVQWYAADAGAHLDIAERAGLMPIKLNTVVIRQVNDDELSDIARLTQHHPWHVRFIELMPVG
ncbi:MAG TPA: GTP 3',8-cyclase MoaA, partial [Anaerolineales bacterium]|nr:GTP 3',8-cyclase MoaA [Anaerolineales bacterium]